MTIRPLPLVIAIAVLFGAGGVLAFILTRPTPVIVPHREDVVTSGTTASHTINDRGTYYEIKAVYPYQTSLPEAQDAHAAATMKTWVDETIDEFKKNGNFDALTAEDIEIQGLNQGRTYALDIEYQFFTGTRTVSYVFQVYEDTLGAHPNAYYRTFTFDSVTGAELVIGDLFTSPAYVSLLSKIARPILRTQIANAGEISPDQVDTQMLNAGTEPKEDNFAWFYLEGTNLVLIFPPYSVGPWAIGTQEVVIPLTEIRNQLKSVYAQN
jgi:Protein of unknown function (DUF3298)